MVSKSTVYIPMLVSGVAMGYMMFIPASLESIRLLVVMGVIFLFSFIKLVADEIMAVIEHTLM